MNMKEWKIQSRLPKDARPKNIYYYRNKAVEFFNLQKNEVIHHLMETEEQKLFNTLYYERWGFDFDGQMKYCVKMSKEDHDKYHSTLRKGKHNSESHKQKCSIALKAYAATEEGKQNIKKAHEIQWADENSHKKQSETVKKYFSNIENRKKLSETIKQFSFWTDGEHTVYQIECPPGWHKGKGLLKCDGSIRLKRSYNIPSAQKYKGKLLFCVETEEIFNIYDKETKERIPKHAVDVANGKRNKAGGYHWKWIDKEEKDG